jgi:hypothetical protein
MGIHLRKKCERAKRRFSVDTPNFKFTTFLKLKNVDESGESLVNRSFRTKNKHLNLTEKRIQSNVVFPKKVHVYIA